MILPEDTPTDLAKLIFELEHKVRTATDTIKHLRSELERPVARVVNVGDGNYKIMNIVGVWHAPEGLIIQVE